jgi:acetyl-CoA acetyltransferase
MGLSPVPAVKNLLSRSGLGLGDFELIEVNEAFAAQYLGVEKELGLTREITNVNGSGIGLGHPVGAAGARIMITLMHAAKKQGKQLGLATLCGGGGVSIACAIGDVIGGSPKRPCAEKALLFSAFRGYWQLMLLSGYGALLPMLFAGY